MKRLGNFKGGGIIKGEGYGQTPVMRCFLVIAMFLGHQHNKEDCPKGLVFSKRYKGLATETLRTRQYWGSVLGS